MSLVPNLGFVVSSNGEKFTRRATPSYLVINHYPGCDTDALRYFGRERVRSFYLGVALLVKR